MHGSWKQRYLYWVFPGLQTEQRLEALIGELRLLGDRVADGRIRVFE